MSMVMSMVSIRRVNSVPDVGLGGTTSPGLDADALRISVWRGEHPSDRPRVPNLGPKGTLYNA